VTSPAGDLLPTNKEPAAAVVGDKGTHLSSNFSMRLAGAATKMVNGSTGITTTVPIPPVG
jgi:hypothetical protein